MSQTDPGDPDGDGNDDDYQERRILAGSDPAEVGAAQSLAYRMLLTSFLFRVCGAKAGGGEEDGDRGVGVGSMEKETKLAHLSISYLE